MFLCVRVSFLVLLTCFHGNTELCHRGTGGFLFLFEELGHSLFELLCFSTSGWWGGGDLDKTFFLRSLERVSSQSILSCPMYLV